MCTVTYIPSPGRTFLTSNRDEKRWRSQAEAPEFHTLKTGRVLFPRDRDAGGTWFAVHENGNSLVLLNGGLCRHIPQPPYRKSRGLVLLDLVDHDDPVENFEKYDLTGIEPFTLIMHCQSGLSEGRWDGQDRKIRSLAAGLPHIWSSVTLYEPEVITRREAWFEAWIRENPSPEQEDILWFHQFTGDGDRHNDLMMNRDGLVFTVSITSLASTHTGGRLQYLDFRDQLVHDREIIYSKSLMPH